MRRRSFPLIALITLVALVAAVTAAWAALATPRYSARSMLLVSASPPRLILDTNDRASGSAAEYALFQKTQVELMKSRYVLGKALAHPKVAKLPSVLKRTDPIEWLADELTITFVGELLYIGLASDEPQEVVALVNAVTDAYLEEVVNADNRRRQVRLGKLKEILRELNEKMSRHEQNLKALAVRASTNDKQTVEYRNKLAMERASRAEQDLRTVRTQLREARIALETREEPAGAEAQEKRIALLEREEASLVAELKKFDDELQSLHQNSLSLGSTEDEIRFTATNAEIIGQEIANLEIELDAPSRVQLYEYAQVATRR